MYRLIISKRAIKEFRKLPREAAAEIRKKLDLLAENPQRSDLDVKNLRGRSGYRLRYRDWRILYDINEGVLRILVLRAAHRKDIYR